MKDLFLLLGSNVPEKRSILSQAAGLIEKEAGIIIHRSSVYETEPWGFEAEESFYNQVLQMRTSLPAIVILEKCIAIELEMGRKRTGRRYESRIIDIDILFYGSLIMKSPQIEIPHPRLHLRRFTLEPLNEIAPDLIHPRLRKKISYLLNECRDTCWVKRLAEFQ
jgi:2-amino-4-hydroxy-6-hydroxymethyldihydropteridine diphosphokinase